MSRIGKQPVQIPAGVTVTVDGTHVTVKGSKGELERTFSDLIVIEEEGNEIHVPRTSLTRTSSRPRPTRPPTPCRVSPVP